MDLLAETLTSCKEVLPEEDHETAERYIREAFERGWTAIGFWSYDEPATLSDLFGVNPHTALAEQINPVSLAYVPNEEEIKIAEENRRDLLQDLQREKTARVLPRSINRPLIAIAGTRYEHLSEENTHG